MLEINFVLVLSIVLLSLTIILILLFIKHLDFMYAFIEEIRRDQILLHKEILEINMGSIKNQNNNPKSQVNKQIADLKSSQISNDELEKLIKGKDLMFKDQVNLHPDKMFKDTNINI